MGNLHSRRHVYRKELLDHEKPWVDLQPFLLRRGYKLRPRYQPSWTPSWKRFGDFGGHPWNREDGTFMLNSFVIDAIRVSDGVKVAIKMVPTDSEELPIMMHLNSCRMRADPRNNTVAVLDVLLMPHTDDTALVVMPILMRFATIPFCFVSEFCDAFQQFLLGLVFLHEHNITHRDVCFLNLMMDGSKVVPNGFHFFNNATEDSVSQPIHYLDRRSVAPVNYHLIDFGLSLAFPASYQHRRVYGKFGQDRTVPEMKSDLPYDPFMSDVYQLGNVLKKVIEGYDGLEQFTSISIAMTLSTPEERPSAQEAYNLFEKTVSSLSEDELKGRIWYKKCTVDLRRRIEFCNENPPELLTTRNYINI